MSDRLKLQSRIEYGSKGGALSNASLAYSKWLKTHTGIKYNKKTGAKETVWKIGPKKGQPFDASQGEVLFNQEFYGTATPHKDLKYLTARDKSQLKINTLRNDSIRTRLSDKDYLGQNIYQQEVDQKEIEAQQRLNKMKIGTSFEGPQPGTNEYILANPNLYPSSVVRRASNDAATAVDKDNDRDTPVQKTDIKVEKPKVNANEVGGESDENKSAADVVADKLRISSDVHTLDAEGKAVGVLTRSQREKFEQSDHWKSIVEKLKVNPSTNIRTYKDRKGNVIRRSAG